MKTLIATLLIFTTLSLGACEKSRDLWQRGKAKVTGLAG